MASERIQRQIDRLLDQAEEAMGRLEWGTVRECARVVLGLDSTNSDALAFLGSVEQVLPGEPGRPRSAVAILRYPHQRARATHIFRQRPLPGQTFSW